MEEYVTAARKQLVLVAAVQVLVMATWFSAAAVLPALRAEWHLGAGSASWLTASVQLGFVSGAVVSALLNLPDVVPVHRLVAVSACAAAMATAAVAAFADGLAIAVALRFATGVALAGVYPPGLKLAGSWFDRDRGFAMGVLVGALTVGSALPHLVNGVATLPWRAVLYVASGLALAGAVVALSAVRPGPYAAPAPPFAPGFVLTLFRQRRARLSSLGYFGHMWELYAMWTWVPAYLAASYTAHGGNAPGRLPAGVASFVVIGVAGAAGCLVAGRLGDRTGRARLAAAAMATSSTCCVLAAAVFGRHPLLVLAVLFVWGFSVIADSGLFSTCTIDVVDRRYAGTALTTQTAIGFLLTVVTIHATPHVVDLTGWRVAVLLLAVGPAAGAAAMTRLHRLTASAGSEVAAAA